MVQQREVDQYVLALKATHEHEESRRYRSERSSINKTTPEWQCQFRLQMF